MRQSQVSCPQIMHHGYDLPTLAKVAHELGCPVNNAFAELLWILSHQIEPRAAASAFLESAGYVPFSGFPLVRRED